MADETRTFHPDSRDRHSIYDVKTSIGDPAPEVGLGTSRAARTVVDLSLRIAYSEYAQCRSLRLTR